MTVSLGRLPVGPVTVAVVVFVRGGDSWSPSRSCWQISHIQVQSLHHITSSEVQTGPTSDSAVSDFDWQAFDYGPSRAMKNAYNLGRTYKENTFLWI
jgi:hypothetical protein